LVSIDTLYSISEVKESVLTDPVVVVDLGAGWGRLGYVFKLANPNCTYVICDLPEALMVSSSYLPSLLPQETVYSYAENRKVREFSRSMLLEPAIRFCGAHHFGNFQEKSIDILINVSSFQEMTQLQVDQYFEVIDQKVHGTFYTQQLWDSQTHNNMRDVISGFGSYPFRAHWSRHYARNTSWSDLYFEAAYSVP
jgi:putative sugar O-methyltransferase